MEQQTAATQAVISTFLQNLGQQDADGIQACFADTIDWHVPGDPSLPWIGARSRGNQVADFFRTMWPYYEKGKSTAQVDNLLISGEHAVMLGVFSHTVVSTGKAFTTPVAMHLQVQEGKIVRMHLYEDTLAIARAFTK